MTESTARRNKSTARRNKSTAHRNKRRQRLPRSLLDQIRAREPKRGLLIAFEGPDGAGKSTQRRLFKTWLEHEGYEVVSAKPATSRGVRPLLKVRSRLRVLSAEELCLLQAADFRYRLETEILPALWQGKIVVADRFLFSSLARASARGLDLDWLLAAHAPLFWPDIVFYFAVSAETSTTRVASTKAPKYYDAGQDVTRVADPIGSYRRFIGRMIREYESLALIFQFVTIDGEQPIYEQHRHIRQVFNESGRKPWGQWNEEAIAEWLTWSPAAAEVRHGASPSR